MPDPQTSNIQLYVPVSGADVGTWDVPMNANYNQLDALLGNSAGIALTNLPVTLSAAQYNTNYLYFTGNLTGNVAITFPPYGRRYTVQSFCTGNVTFNITCLTTAAGGQAIGLPPGQAMSLICDTVNMRFANLPPVGSYLDLGVSTVPGWITACTVPPYLNCNGAGFSSGTYPNLRDYLGSAVLPDTRGRFRAAMNQGTARLPAYADTLASAGGSQTIAQANLPSYALPVTDPGHIHTYLHSVYQTIFAAGTARIADVGTVGTDNTGSNTTGITVNSGGSGTGYSPPGYAGGLTLIRAG